MRHTLLSFMAVAGAGLLLAGCQSVGQNSIGDSSGVQTYDVGGNGRAQVIVDDTTDRGDKNRAYSITGNTPGAPTHSYSDYARHASNRL